MSLYQAYTDEQLLSLLGNSDEAAFIELFNRYWPAIYRDVRRATGSAKDAEDIVDLRRWKKMDYAVTEKLGRWIKKGTDVPANSIIPIQQGASEGYISYEGVPPSPFPDYYYLYPIPSAKIVLNPKIVQNPGWK